MGKSNTEQARVEVILNGEKANATLNEMRAAARALNAELGKIPDPLNSSEFAAGKQKLDDLKSKINDVSGKAKEAGDSFKSMVRSVTGITLGYAAVGMALGKFTSFLKDSIQASMEEESALAKLKFAVNGNSEAFDRMVRFRDQLYKTTLFSKEQVDSAINMSLELGRTESQTRKMIETAMGLSRVTGQDLNSVMIQLNGTYEGQTGRLGRLATGITSLSKTQLENGGAVDILNEKYGKFASQGMNTMEGGVSRLSKAWEKFKENTGQAAVKSMVENFGVVGALLAKVTGMITGNEALDEQRAKIKQIQDNIAAMRDEAKKTADVNTYYRDLDKNAEEKDLEEMQRKAQEYANKLLEIRENLKDSLIQLITDEREKELRLNNLDLERKLAEIKGNSKEENDLRDQLNAIALQKEQEINQKFDDKKIQDALKTEKEKWEAIIKADGQGSAEWFLDSKTLLEKLQEIELNNTNLTEQQKLDIKEKYLKLEQALEEKFATGSDKPDKESKTPSGSLITSSGADKIDALNYAKKRQLLQAEYNAELVLAKDNVGKKELL